MKQIRAAWLATVLISIVLLASCKKDGWSTLNVYLTDSPAAFSAVNIEVVNVQVKVNADQDESGWITLPVSDLPAIYNLLDLKNGNEIFLASGKLPSGNIAQLRLILGSNNSIVEDGVNIPLELDVPSGQQTGLKMNINYYLFPGIEHELWIDFDAGRSIIKDATGGYKLKPVLRTFNSETSGSITGFITPTAARAELQVSNAISTFYGTADTTTGKFMIRGLPDGKWNLFIHGQNGYLDKLINNVTINIGQATNIGTITLTQ